VARCAVTIGTSARTAKPASEEAGTGTAEDAASEAKEEVQSVTVAEAAAADTKIAVVSRRAGVIVDRTAPAGGGTKTLTIAIITATTKKRIE